MASVSGRKQKKGVSSMKSLKMAAFAALTVLVFAVPAQSARRDGLNQNILIEDHDDVFFFPHKVQSAHNANRVRLDHSANGTAATVFSKSGRGGWGLGIAQDSPDHAVIDAFYSLGDLGFRLQLASDSDKVDGEGASSIGIGLTVGYGIRGIGDAAFIFNMLTGEDAAKTKSSNMNISGGLRGYKPKGAGGADLGYTIGFQFGSESVEPDGGDAQEGSSLLVQAGVGPVWRLKKKSTVAIHATVGFSTATDPAETVTQNITVPGVNVAFETGLNDWVNFRGGVGYEFALASTTPDGGDAATTHEGATTAAMGLSAHWGDLNFDVALNRDFLLNGPYLLTGNSTAGWASNVAVTYKW